MLLLLTLVQGRPKHWPFSETRKRAKWRERELIYYNILSTHPFITDMETLVFILIISRNEKI